MKTKDVRAKRVVIRDLIRQLAEEAASDWMPE
jgi:hypothetical protein